MEKDENRTSNETQRQEYAAPPQQLQSPPPEYAGHQARRHEQRRKRTDMPGEKQGYRKGQFGRTLAKWVAAAAVLGLVAGAGMQAQNYLQEKRQSNMTANSEKNSNAASAEETEVQEYTSVSQIVEHAMPSIVAITNVTEVQQPFWFGTTQEEEPSAGSGIIVSQDKDNLYIATNNHVVANAKSLSVCFCDEETVDAQVKGVDSGWDLAVVSVKLSDIPKKTQKNIRIATLGDSEKLQVGQPAIAIGNALGYGQSVTRGSISAVNREVDIQDENTGKSSKSYLIQTDSAINPGNSGGALLNTKGEVIGISSAKYSGQAVEGMGYAIPMKDAQPIIQNLITREVVSPAESASMGVVGLDVTSDVADVYDKPEGIYISKVERGSAAEKAGLVPGMIITQFDGHKVTSMSDMQDLMQYYAAGAKVDVIAEVSNNGAYKEKTFEVTLDRKK